MMFFQIALLVGYLYAHLSRKFLSPRICMIVHCVAALTAGVLLNFDALHSTPRSDTDLSLAVCIQLTISLGAAFIVISATSPLLQSWFSISHPQQNPYRLYALSNAGSVLGLIAYPILVERLDLKWQSFAWMCLFFLLVGMLAISGLQILTAAKKSISQTQSVLESESKTEKAPFLDLILWIVLSATASLLLISIATFLSQEVAAHPFLWVLPLAIYLMTIIVCFERPGWYRRRLFQPLLTISAFSSVILFHLGTNAGLTLQAFGFLALLFVGSVVCHGELYRLRPNSTNLTSFYLAMALGGAIGGIFGVLIAPRIFNGFFELHVAVLLCTVTTTFIAFARQDDEDPSARLVNGYFFVSILASAPIVCSLLYFLHSDYQPNLLFRERNAYGMVSVSEDDQYRKMFNGQTNHGGQFLSEEKSNLASAYYSLGSGVDIAFQYARSQRLLADKKLNVGVIGLGSGAMLTYSKPGDQFTFYEINPVCETAARKYFTFLNEFEPEIIVGDGRIELQNELSHESNASPSGSREFDLIFLDAFSSDSIPIHLLTQEAIELYLKHLGDDGILIFHITNRFIDLRPVIRNVCRSHELTMAMLEHHDQEFDIHTRWIIASKNPELSKSDIILKNRVEIPDDLPNVQWTDQCAPLTPVVIWSNEIRSTH